MRARCEVIDAGAMSVLNASVIFPMVASNERSSSGQIKCVACYEFLMCASQVGGYTTSPTSSFTLPVGRVRNLQACALPVLYALGPRAFGYRLQQVGHDTNAFFGPEADCLQQASCSIRPKPSVSPAFPCLGSFPDLECGLRALAPRTCRGDVYGRTTPRSTALGEAWGNQQAMQFKTNKIHIM